jgi:hypothetical protein
LAAGVVGGPPEERRVDRPRQNETDPYPGMAGDRLLKIEGQPLMANLVME